MMKEWFRSLAMLDMEMAGLVIFVSVFAVIVVWTLRASGKSYYETLARMPLREQEGESHGD